MSEKLDRHKPAVPPTANLYFTQLKTAVTELHIYSAVHNILLIFIIVKPGLLTVTLP